MLIDVLKFIDSPESHEIGLSYLEILVLIALGNLTGDNDRCWPKLSQLINRCHTNERSLRRTFRSLESKGLLTIKTRSGRESFYYLTLPLTNNLPTPGTSAGGTDGVTPGTFGKNTDQTPGTFGNAIEKSNYSLKQKQLTTKAHTNFSRTKNEQNHRPYPSAGRKPKDPVRERLRELAREAGLETWLEDFDEDANAVPAKI